MAYESLYDQDPSLLLNETFNSQNTVRGTIVGTPTFSNGTMTTSAVGNYINSTFDFSGRNKFTVRIKGTFSANKDFGLSQGDSTNNKVFFGTRSDGFLYAYISNLGNAGGYIAIPGGTYDLFFVYDGTQSTNATKIKIYKGGTLQTLGFSGTIATVVPSLASKNSRIGNIYVSSYTTSTGTFEQVQIWNRVLGTDEIQARTNNSIYKNVNPIMNLKKWIKVTGTFVEKYETTGNSIIALGQKYFECTNGGTIMYPIKQAYGTFEWSINRAVQPNVFFSYTGTTSTNGQGFIVQLNSSTGKTTFLRGNNGTFTTTMLTSGIDTVTNTWYRFKVTRSASNVFSLYKKSGNGQYVLVDLTGGSGTNPYTDTNFTINIFFLLSFSTGDCISDIRFTPYID